MSPSKILLIWYREQAYIFPWRSNKYPYNIWISEIMLQQTQVQIVIPYYLNWIEKYPNIKILQKETIDNLLLAWQGLGYYKRVQNILSTAKIIVKQYNGQFPNQYDDLIKLHGIGDYTASMILSIAFNQNEYVPIDGNIKRIMSRLHAIPVARQTLKNYKKYTKKYIDSYYPGDSIQALMDLGREVCKPQSPNCIGCPLKKNCKARNQGNVEKFPYKKNNKTLPHYDVVVGLIWKNNKFVISRRLKDKLLGNLWELPGGKIKKDETKLECLNREIKEELDIEICNATEIGIIHHQYSHMKLSITLFNCQYKSGIAKALSSQGIKWITYNEKKDFAFPNATHKLFKLIQDIK